MRAEELIGKWAIRTAPNKDGDLSWTKEPIIIHRIDEFGIATSGCNDEHFNAENPWYLDKSWLDDSWAEYKYDLEFLRKELSDLADQLQACRNKIEVLMTKFSELVECESR